MCKSVVLQFCAVSVNIINDRKTIISSFKIFSPLHFLWWTVVQHLPNLTTFVSENKFYRQLIWNGQKQHCGSHAVFLSHRKLNPVFYGDFVLQPATGHQPSPPPAANFKLFDPFKNAILSSASRPSDSDKLTFKSDLSKHIFLHEKYFDCKQKNIFIFSWCGIRDHERINIPYLTFAWVFPLYQL